MLCAGKRAFNPNNAEMHFSSLPLALIHPRNIRLRVATAARNGTSYRWPPANAFSLCDGTAPLALKTGSNSPPLAQPHPRNTPCVRERAV
jgi:hypothetical protein